MIKDLQINSSPLLNAVAISKNWIKNYSLSNSKHIKQFVSNLFEKWKNDNGCLPCEYAVSENEQKELDALREHYVSNNVVWDCLPLGVKPTPLDLLAHIKATKYIKIKDTLFFNIMAHTIVHCAEEGNPNYFNSIIKWSLWLAAIDIKTLESQTNKMKPSFDAELKRLNASLKGKQEQKNKTDKIVSASYKKAIQEGWKSGFQKYVIRDTGLNKNTVSESFKRQELKPKILVSK